MATHLVAFRSSIAQNQLLNLDVGKGEVITVTEGNKVIIPEGYNVLKWAFAGSANIRKARIVTPSLERKLAIFDIMPLGLGTETVDPIRFPIFIPPRAISFDTGESLEVKALQAGAAAENVTALVSLGPETLPEIPAGEIRMNRGSMTVSTVAGQWVIGSPVWEKPFEVGTYSLVGIIAAGQNATAIRAVLLGQGFRPGVPILAAADLGAAALFNYQNYKPLIFYNMGTFTNRSLPQFEVFGTAAGSNTYDILIYFVKTG